MNVKQNDGHRDAGKWTQDDIPRWPPEDNCRRLVDLGIYVRENRHQIMSENTVGRLGFQPVQFRSREGRK
jgi:hypothetical protein